MVLVPAVAALLVLLPRQMTTKTTMMTRKHRKALKVKVHSRVGRQHPADVPAKVVARMVAQANAATRAVKVVAKAATRVVAKVAVRPQPRIREKSLKMQSTSWRICSNEPSGQVGRTC